MEWIKTKDKLPTDDNKNYFIIVNGVAAIGYGIPEIDGSWLHSDIGDYEPRTVSFVNEEIKCWKEIIYPEDC